MDIVLVLLRLIHIVAAVIWFGAGFSEAFVVMPAVAASGTTGKRFFVAMSQNRFYQMLFPVVALLTVLAGILLYLVGNSASHFSSTGNAVLGIGAVAGILAVLHGAAVLGRAGASLAEAISQNLGDDGITAEGAPLVAERMAYLARHNRITFVLMVIALVGMASARYL